MKIYVTDQPTGPHVTRSNTIELVI